MGIAAHGTQLRRWNSGTASWDKIAEITSIGGPDINVDIIDVTALDSPGANREFVAGLIDNGEMALELNWTRPEHEQFLTDLEARTLNSYELILPDAETTTYFFSALVTGLTLGGAVDDKITSSATLTISGGITDESGSGPSAGA